MDKSSFLESGQFWAEKFLWYFAQEISKSVTKDKTLYIPTQIVCDLIEDELPDIDGIIYRSSKIKGEKNVVMFMDDKCCLDNLILNSYKIIPN